MFGAAMAGPPAGGVPGLDPAALLAAAAGGQADGDGDTVLDREKPEPDPARAAAVKEWVDRVKRGKDHFKKTWKRIDDDMWFARHGANEGWPEDNYTANIIQRHVNSRVAALYARNPRATAKRRRQMDFKLWDGNPQALMQAMQAVQTGMDMTGQAGALLQDVQAGLQHKTMIDKVARTLEILFDYFTNEQDGGFKQDMKQMVRRAVVTCVGFVEVDFQRAMESRPEISAQIADATQRLDEMRRIAADLADGEIEHDDAAVEQLRVMIQELQAQEYVVVREGLVFDFPRPKEIIVDPKCRSLRTFAGARWIAREMMMDPDEIERVYKKDIGTAFTSYKPDAKPQVAPAQNPADGKSSSQAMVWRIQDKQTGTVLTVCDGYPDYLEEPKAPDAKIDRFFTIFALTLNEVEDDKDLYPVSDVSLIRPMQEEYNRARQGLREQRQANRPKYVTPKGRLEEEDKAKLRSGAANEILELNSLAPGDDPSKLIAHLRPAPIDPALYDTSMLFEDVQRTVGTQEANLGNTGKTTATESSIAEGSRATTTSSNVDDLDEMLSAIARASGQIMLENMTPQMVTRIVGPGAVWPQLSRQEIAEELFLDIKAGSSGRPNKAQELANLERAAPTILQIPGINPVWFARQVLERLDDDLDIDEALIEGLPAMVAQNAQSRATMPTGDPKTDPGQQGAQGSGNAPAAQQRQQGPQPAMPAPQAAGPGQPQVTR